DLLRTQVRLHAVVRNVGDQAIPAFGNCLNVAWFFAVVPEGLAQFRDRPCQDIIGYDGISPDSLHELFFRYHLSRSVSQALKHLHYLGSQPRRLVISGDSVELRLNEKFADPESTIHHHPPTLK